jgi:hypothetical protein
VWGWATSEESDWETKGQRPNWSRAKREAAWRSLRKRTAELSHAEAWCQGAADRPVISVSTATKAAPAMRARSAGREAEKLAAVTCFTGTVACTAAAIVFLFLFLSLFHPLTPDLTGTNADSHQLLSPYTTHTHTEMGRSGLGWSGLGRSGPGLASLGEDELGGVSTGEETTGFSSWFGVYNFFFFFFCIFT